MLSHRLLFVTPMDCGPPGSSVHGIFQARILSGLPLSTPGDLPDPWIKPASHWQTDSLQILYCTTWEAPSNLCICHLLCIMHNITHITHYLSNLYIIYYQSCICLMYYIIYYLIHLSSYTVNIN